ncbi:MULTISPECIES: hypothetical protein [Rhodobacterales]|uniref:hypothetical protein n=1 Tax=Rhodobacterales TaxID=204455 RepID=UPI0011BF677B|nr:MULTISPECIES: hypothetical protein [Rhodobacterales]MDO6592160.1 hypothetical protein [Yoonia sp. 1_MG-2023]
MSKLIEVAMASKSRKLRKSFKLILEPAMAEAGYVVDCPNFRRDRGDTLDVVDIQFWKEGGAFILNVARYVGPLEGLNGFSVPRDRIEIGMLPALRQDRIGPTKSKRMEKLVGWYKFDDIWDDQDSLDKLSEEVVGLLPQLEAWLEDGSMTPNISPESSTYP